MESPNFEFAIPQACARPFLPMPILVPPASREADRRNRGTARHGQGKGRSGPCAAALCLLLAVLRQAGLLMDAHTSCEMGVSVHTWPLFWVGLAVSSEGVCVGQG